jgi:quinoprotein glucose dehydrogenase
MRTLLVAAASALFVVAVGIQVRAQSAADPDTQIWQGVYTAAQAARGKAVYEAYCTRCHGIDMVGGREGGAGGPALAGANFWLDWERAPVSSLFSKISREMPRDSPGSLRSDDYADLIAYILSGNSFPAGSSEIPSTGAGLDAVRIVRKAGAAAEAANFSLVQVVGCLAPSPGNGWVLTRSTPPIGTRDESPTPAALKDAGTRPLGGDTVRLIGVAHFGPESKVGQKVEARGLLNKLPNETRLDVLSLQLVGQACGG